MFYFIQPNEKTLKALFANQISHTALFHFVPPPPRLRGQQPAVGPQLGEAEPPGAAAQPQDAARLGAIGRRGGADSARPSPEPRPPPQPCPPPQPRLPPTASSTAAAVTELRPREQVGGAQAQPHAAAAESCYNVKSCFSVFCFLFFAIIIFYV